jgi:hypothetical protein
MTLSHVRDIEQECERSSSLFQNSTQTAPLPVLFCLVLSDKFPFSVHDSWTSVYASSLWVLCLFSAFVALFTLPKVYESNKAQIDQNLDIVRSKIADITSK